MVPHDRAAMRAHLETAGLLAPGQRLEEALGEHTEYWHLMGEGPHYAAKKSLKDAGLLGSSAGGTRYINGGPEPLMRIMADHLRAKGLMGTGQRLEDVLGEERELWMMLDQGPCRKAKVSLQRAHLLEEMATYTRPVMPGNLLTSGDIFEAIKAMIALYCDRLALSVHFFGCVRPNAAGRREAVFNLVKGSEKRKYSVCVCNTTSRVDGSHWVVVAINTVTKTVEYWDPMGGGSPSSRSPVGKLLLSIFKSLDRTPERGKYRLQSSHTCHQRGGTECGVYAVWYVTRRVLLGMSMEELNARRVPDAEMRRWRNVFFQPRPPEPEPEPEPESESEPEPEPESEPELEPDPEPVSDPRWVAPGTFAGNDLPPMEEDTPPRIQWKCVPKAWSGESPPVEGKRCHESGPVHTTEVKRHRSDE